MWRRSKHARYENEQDTFSEAKAEKLNFEDELAKEEVDGKIENGEGYARMSIKEELRKVKKMSNEVGRRKKQKKRRDKSGDEI